MKVLFISNSTCNYLADELYGLLAAAGHADAVLGLVYYAGCSVRQHALWYEEDAANYQFRLWDRSGYHTVDSFSLRQALAFAAWDVISFDNNAASFSSGEVQASLKEAEPYFGRLLRTVRSVHPQSRYLWHQVWANEIGYHGAFQMKTLEQRNRVYRAKRGVMTHMQQTYGLEAVPTGDAWEIVRDMPLFMAPIPDIPVDRFTLCTRIRNGQVYDDFSHDGDMGGGQYLNGCVWFEVLTGESCVDNPFCPRYTCGTVDCSLTPEKMSVLQQAAHTAVSAIRK